MTPDYTVAFSICENNKQVAYRKAKVGPEQFAVMSSMQIGAIINLTDSVNVPAERRQEMSALCGAYRIIDMQYSVKVETILSTFAACRHCVIKLVRA